MASQKKNRCWTADRLAKRGLPHPEACPQCDQDEETLQHVLIGCVFSRQIWALSLQILDLAAIAPTAENTSLFSWWAQSIKRVPKEARKGLNTLIILIAWEIWKFRNSCVFEGSPVSIQQLLQKIGNECLLWCMAGATDLQELLRRLPTPVG